MRRIRPLARTAHAGTRSSERGKYVLFVDAFVCGHQPQNAVEGADSQSVVIWNRDPLRGWFICLQNDMTTLLMNLPIVFAERLSDRAAREVARKRSLPGIWWPGTFHRIAYAFSGKCGEIVHPVRNETVDIDTYRPGTNHDSRRRSEALKLKLRQRLFYEIREEGVFIRPETGKPIDLAGYLKSEVTAGTKAEERDNARAARLRKYL
jgi:hypothetical protein